MVDRLFRAMACLHEAGHGVVALRLGYDLRKISDDPPEVVVRFGPNTWRDELTVLMAGDAAVKRAGGQDRSAADDQDARLLLEQVGRSPLELVFATERAETLVDQEWPAIERLATALLRTVWVCPSDARRLLLGGEIDEEAAFLMRLAVVCRAT